MSQVRIAVVGANHQTSSLAVRDSLFVDDKSAPVVLAALRRAGVEQAVVVSTCDRTEITFSYADVEATARRVVEVLAAHAAMPPDALRNEMYTIVDEDAVRHLFRVAASLDSQVIGEPHVLGQLKAAHQAARTAGMTAGELDRVFRAAYGVAKRVRTQTTIGQRPVSIAAAAAEMARRLHGGLDRCTGLLLGVGEMGQLIAETFAGDRLGSLAVCHPQQARAEAVARSLDCHVVAYDSLAQSLAAADIVIAALGARQVTVGADLARSALRRRRYRPIFIIDAAVPGDIDAAVDHLDGVFRYTLGDLERIALEGRSHRETEAPAALRMVDEAVDQFIRERAQRRAVPVVTALHRHVERVRQEALRDAAGDADKATRLLASRLLHRPTAALRSLAAEAKEDENGAGDKGTGEADALERAARHLFGLGGEPEEPE